MKAPRPDLRKLSASDIFNLENAADVQTSPNGRQIAFVQVANDIQSDRSVATLWIVDASGGAPRRLVAGEASAPRWSPDGGRLAYLAAEPHGSTQAHVLSFKGKTSATITHLKESPDPLSWSPDGRLIAFTAFVPGPDEEPLGQALAKPRGAKSDEPLRYMSSKNYVSDGSGNVRPGHTHLFVVSSSGGPVRQLTSGANDDADPAWSPEGRELKFSSTRAGLLPSDLNIDSIVQVNVATSQVKSLSPDFVNGSSPVVSPDGRHIAFVGYFEPHLGDFYPINAYVMDRDGLHARVIDPSLDRITYDPQWTSDGRAVLARYVDRGVQKVGRFGLDGDRKVLAEGLEGPSSVSRTGVIAFPLAASDHPPDVGVMAGKQRRLTRLNDGLLGERTLGVVRPMAVRSSLDGEEVGAWLMLPPGYNPAQRYPTILEIHGGPYGADGPEWRTDSQIFAAAGYVVIYANYRGSVSYGNNFSTAIDRDFPGPAYDDLMSAVDAVVADGIADPQRLYVTGGSAGGELTAWIVGKTHRFRAAVAVKPIVNLLSEVIETDQYLYAATREYATTPWQSPTVFWSHSPLSLVANVTTPTLHMVGQEDHRTLVSQSIEFYNALQIRGVPTGLVRVSGANHDNLEGRPSQRAGMDLAVLAWFARFVGPPAP